MAHPYKRVFKELDIVGFDLADSVKKNSKRPSFVGVNFGCDAVGEEVNSRNLFQLIVLTTEKVKDSYDSYSAVPSVIRKKYKAQNPGKIAGWEK